MAVDEGLQSFSFHANWDLTKNLAKPFSILLQQINEQIDGETHETFEEEGLLFKCYLYKTGVGEKANVNNKKARECLNEAIVLINRWDDTSKKDGFLSVAYALDAWIDIDKLESRIIECLGLQRKNRKNGIMLKHFEAAIHYIKGYTLSRLGGNRYEECIQEFQKANEKSPEEHEYLFSLALMIRRDEGPETDKQVKQMLEKVLEMKPDYLFAKCELASIINYEGNKSGSCKLLEEIVQALKLKEMCTPEDKKIFGNIMKIYRQMKEDKMIKKIFEITSEFGNTSFILHQRALLAERNKNWGDYNIYLRKALEMNKFNVMASLGLAHAELRKASTETVIKKFDEMISIYEGSRAMPIIWSNYGTELFKRNKEMAVVRYEKAFNIAIDCTSTGNQGNHSKPIKINYFIRTSIRICIQNLRKYYRENIQVGTMIYKLSKLEYKLRNIYLARSYCKEALKMEMDDKDKNELYQMLANIEIELATDLNCLEEVEEMTNRLNGTSEFKELKWKLIYKKGILKERTHLNESGFYEFIELAQSGHVDSIKRILVSMSAMDGTSSIFYQTLVAMENGISKVDDLEKELLKEKLALISKNAIRRDLKHLRKQQQDMENAFFLNDNDNVRYVASVIQTCRDKLNKTMTTLSQRYQKKQKDHKLDFICLHNNFDKNQTELKVRKQFRKYNWKEVDSELIRFFVDLQPCMNPKKNNWIKAFIDFNNTEKHIRDNKEYGTYKVYSEDESTESVTHQEKEYCSIELARTVCDNIEYILDNLNGFSLEF